MKYLLLTFGIACIAIFTGCEALDLDAEEIFNTSNDEFSYKPKFVVSLHQIVDYPRAKRLEKRVKTPSGDDIFININQFFSSGDAKKIKISPIDGKENCFYLLMQLSHAGKLKWSTICMNFRGEETAVFVDGIFYGYFIPTDTISNESDWVALKVPFDAATAKSIQKHAPRNFKYFNPKPSRFL